MGSIDEYRDFAVRIRTIDGTIKSWPSIVFFVQQIAWAASEGPYKLQTRRGSFIYIAMAALPSIAAFADSQNTITFMHISLFPSFGSFFDMSRF